MWMLQLDCMYESRPGFHCRHWSVEDAQEVQDVLNSDDHLLLKRLEVNKVSEFDNGTKIIKITSDFVLLQPYLALPVEQ